MLQEKNKTRLSGTAQTTTIANKSSSFGWIKLGLYLFLFLFIGYLVVLFFALNDVNNQTRSIAAYSRLQRSKQDSKLVISGETLHENSVYDPDFTKIERTNNVIRESFGSEKIRLENLPEVGVSADGVQINSAKTEFLGVKVHMNGKLSYNQNGANMQLSMKNNDETLLSQTVSKKNPEHDLGNLEEDQGISSSAVSFSTQSGLEADSEVDAFNNDAIASLFELDATADRDENYIPDTVCRTEENKVLYQNFKAKLKGKIQNNKLPEFEIVNIPDICIQNSTFKNNTVEIKLVPGSESKYMYTFKTTAVLKDIVTELPETGIKMSGPLETSGRATVQITGPLNNFNFGRENELNNYIKLKNCVLSLTISPAKSAQFTGFVNCDIQNLYMFEGKDNLNTGQNQAKVDIEYLLKGNKRNDITLKTDGTFNIEEKITLRNINIRFKNKDTAPISLIQGAVEFNLGHSDAWFVKCKGIGLSNKKNNLILHLSCGSLKWVRIGTELENIFLNYNSETGAQLVADLRIFGRDFKIDQHVKDIKQLKIELPFDSKNLTQLINTGNLNNDLLKEFINITDINNAILNIKSGVLDFSKPIPILMFLLLEELRHNKLNMEKLKLLHIGDKKESIIYLSFTLKKASLNDFLISTKDNTLSSLKIKKINYYNQRFNSINVSIGKFISSSIEDLQTIDQTGFTTNGVRFKFKTEFYKLLTFKTGFVELDSLIVWNKIITDFDHNILSNEIISGEEIVIGGFIGLNELRFRMIDGKVNIKRATINIGKDKTNLNLSMLNNKRTSAELEQNRIVLVISDTIEIASESLSNLKLTIEVNKGKYKYTLEGLKTFTSKNTLNSVPFSITHPNTTGLGYNSIITDSNNENKEFKTLCPNAIEVNRETNLGKLKLKIENFNLTTGCISILVNLSLFGKNYELRLQKTSITEQEKNESYLSLKGSLYADNSIFSKPLNIELHLPVNHETKEIGTPLEMIKIKLEAKLDLFGGTLFAHVDNLTDTTKQCEIRIHNLSLKDGFLLIKDMIIHYNQEVGEFNANANISLKNHFDASLTGSFKDQDNSWYLEGYVKNPLPNLPETETDIFKLIVKSNPLFIALESNFYYGNYKIVGMLIYDQLNRSFNVKFPIIQLGPYVQLKNLQLVKNNEEKEIYQGSLTLGECANEKDSAFCLNSLGVNVIKTEKELKVDTRVEKISIDTPFGLNINIRDVKVYVSKQVQQSPAKLEKDSSMLLNFNDSSKIQEPKDYRVNLSGEGSIKLNNGKEFKLQTIIELHDDMLLELSATNTTLALVELLETIGVPGLDKLGKYLDSNISNFSIKIAKTGNKFEVIIRQSGNTSKKDNLFIYFSPSSGHYIVSYLKTTPTSLSEIFQVNSNFTIQNLKLQATNCAATYDCSKNKATNELIKALKILDNNKLIFEGEVSFGSLSSHLKDIQPVLDIGAKPISSVKVSAVVDLIKPTDRMVMTAELDNIKIGNSVDLSIRLYLEVINKELVIRASSSILIAKNKYMDVAKIDMEFTSDKDKVMFFVKGGSPNSKDEIKPVDISIKYNNVSLLALENIDIELIFSKQTNKLEQSHFYGVIKLPEANKQIKATVELFKPEEVEVSGSKTTRVSELTIDLDVSDLTIEDTVKCFGDESSMPNTDILNNKLTEKGDMKKILRNGVGSLQIKVRTEPEIFVLVDIKANIVNKEGDIINFDFILVVETLEGSKNVTMIFKIDGNSNLIDLDNVKSKNEKLKNMKIFKGLFLLSYYSDISSIKKLSHKLNTDNIIEKNCNFDFYKKHASSSSLPSLSETDGSLFICFDGQVDKMADTIDFDIDVVFVGYLNRNQLIISGELNYIKYVNKKRGIDIRINDASLFIEKAFNRNGITLKIKVHGSVKIISGKEYVDFNGYIDLEDNALLTEIEVKGSINIIGDFYLTNARLYVTLQQENQNDYIRLEGKTEISTLPSSFIPVSKGIKVKKGYFEILLYLDLNQLSAGLRNIKDIGVLLYMKAENFNFGNLLPKVDNLAESFVHKALTKIKIGKVSFIFNTLSQTKQDESIEETLDTKVNPKKPKPETGLITEENFKILNALTIRSDISQFPVGISFNLEDISFFNFRGLARFRHHNKLLEVYCVIYPLEIKLGSFPILSIRGINKENPNFELVLKRNKGISSVRVKGGIFVFGVIGGLGTIIRDDVIEPGVWNINGEVKLLINYQLTMKITGDNLLEPKKIAMRMFAGPASFSQVFIDIEKRMNSGQAELEKRLNSSLSINAIEDAYMKVLKTLYKRKSERILYIYRRQRITTRDLQDYIKINLDIDEDQRKEDILNKELSCMEKKIKEDDSFKSIQAKVIEIKKQIAQNQQKIKRRWSYFKRFRLRTKSWLLFDIKKAFDTTIIKLNFKIAGAWVKYIMKKIGHYTVKYLGKPMLILSKWIIRALSLGQAILSVRSMEAIIEDVDISKEMQVARVTLVTMVGPDEIKAEQEMNVGQLTSYWTMVSTIIVLIIKVVIQLGKDLFQVFKKFAALVGA